MTHPPKKPDPEALSRANKILGPKPKQSVLLRNLKRMKKHFEKHAPKKPDETSEFRLHFDYLTGEPL